MIGNLFTTLLIEPIYNVFVALITYIPGHDAGFAVIAVTIIIRIIFLPAFTQALRTQHGMRKVEPELDAIKKKYKDDRQEQAKASMEVFKKHKIKPFATFFSLLIQLPVFIALYAVFLREGFPQIATHLLYSFTPAPESVGIYFLGLLDLTATKNILLALLVAGIQFAQSRLSMGAMQQPKDAAPEKLQMLLIQRQMLYIIPLVMGVVSFTAPAAAGLYLLTNAVISLLQELLVRRRIDAEFAAKEVTKKTA